jgi:hypothetical protein
MNLFYDLFIQTDSVKKSKSHLNFLNDKYKNEKDIFFVSYVSEFFDIYSDYPLSDYSERLKNVRLIPSFMIQTKENIQVLCCFPKKSAIEILNKINKIKENRIIHIIDNLIDREVFIFINSLLEKTDKKLYQLNSSDICQEITDSGYSETIEEAFDEIFLRENVDDLHISVKEILNLTDEKIYLLNPENNHDLIEHNNIFGTIINDLTPNEIINKSILFQKDTKYGSGIIL